MPIASLSYFQPLDNMFRPASPPKQKMDWDKVCAYKTLRIVRIKDRFLGMVYWGELM